MQAESQVDLTHCASLTFGKLLGVDDRSGDDFVEPTPAACNGSDQTSAAFDAIGSDFLSRNSMREWNFSKTFEGWLLPSNREQVGSGYSSTGLSVTSSRFFCSSTREMRDVSF